MGSLFTKKERQVSNNKNEMITNPESSEPEVDALTRVAEAHYQNLPADEFKAILAMEKPPEIALASLSGLLAHYKGSLKPEEIEQVLAVVESEANNDEPYKLIGYRHGVANMLIFKYGDQLSLTQIDRTLTGMSANRLGGWALESLVTVHNRELTDHQLDFMLERWNIDSLKQAVIDRYGSRLSSERIDAILDELEVAKKRAGEQLDREIKSRGPYLDVSDLPAYRYRDDLDEKARYWLLNESCPEIHNVLASIAKNCAGNLSKSQVYKLHDLGNAFVSAHIITYCWEGMSDSQRSQLQHDFKSDALDIFCCLVDHDLPMLDWKEKLISSALDYLEESDYIHIEWLTSEPYLGHFSDSNIERLIRSKVFRKYLFKSSQEVNYPQAAVLQERMDTIIEVHGKNMLSKWFDHFADRLTQDNLMLIRRHCGSYNVGYLMENFPELSEDTQDVESRVNLIVEKGLNYISSEWIGTYHQYLSSDQVDRIVDHELGGYGDNVILAITQHCPEKVSSQQIRQISKRWAGDRGREYRPLLVEAYWQHYLENFNGWIRDTHFHTEFLKQHSDKLSDSQIEEWLEEINIFYMEKFITYCGSRINSSQIDRCWEIMYGNTNDSSIYYSVERRGRRSIFTELLIKNGGGNMSEERINQLIKIDKEGAYCSMLLEHHPNNITPEQKQEIILRFGHSHNRVNLDIK